MGRAHKNVTNNFPPLHVALTYQGKHIKHHVPRWMHGADYICPDTFGVISASTYVILCLWRLYVNDIYLYWWHSSSSIFDTLKNIHIWKSNWLTLQIFTTKILIWKIFNFTALNNNKIRSCGIGLYRKWRLFAYVLFLLNKGYGHSCTIISFLKQDYFCSRQICWHW